MIDILKRLRGWAAVEKLTSAMSLSPRGSAVAGWVDEAADEIDRLRDVIARCDAEIAALQDQALRSDAEIERLRALLRDVAASRVIYPADWLDRVFDVQVEADTWAALDEFRTDHHDREQ